MANAEITQVRVLAAQPGPATRNAQVTQVRVFASEPGAATKNAVITQVRVFYAVPNIPAPPEQQFTLQTRSGNVILLDVQTVNGSIYYLNRKSVV